MHIKVKENKIIVEFTEKESAFIMQKAGGSELQNVSNYIKEKLIKALSLQDIEISVQNVGKDFNLGKIKKVTAELKKRNRKNKPTDVNDEIVRTDLLEDIALGTDTPGAESNKADKAQNEEFNEITAEIGDELLADLLDKDLLKRRQKPKTKDES